jgi:hypothetical protein
MRSVEHWLAAAERNHRRAEIGKLVDAPPHRRSRNGCRDLVVLVAVAAVDVAAADGYDLDEEWMRGV